MPPSWATATPAIRTVAAALSAAGPQAVPAAALSAGSLLSSMSVAGMLGSALGAGAPSALTCTRTGGRHRLTPLADLKDATSPDNLKRLVAQISEKPETVQHHTVDHDGLDALLDQLSKNRVSTPCTYPTANPKSFHPTPNRANGQPNSVFELLTLCALQFRLADRRRWCHCEFRSAQAREKDES